MKINKALLENAQTYDPFSDMPAGTKEACRLAADLALTMKNYRKAHKLNQSELALLLQMKQSQISKIENGESNLTIAKMQEVLDILGYKTKIVPTSAGQTVYRSAGTRVNSGWISGGRGRVPQFVVGHA